MFICIYVYLCVFICIYMYLYVFIHAAFGIAFMGNNNIALIDLGSSSFYCEVLKISSYNGLLESADIIKFTFKLKYKLEKLDEKTGFNSKELDDLEKIFRSFVRNLKNNNINLDNNLILTGAHSFRELSKKHKLALKQVQDLALVIFGKKIHILTEQEEASFIYLGAIYKSPNKNKLNLVIDIGGGSTEVILGQGEKILFLQSLPIGCVGINKNIMNIKASIDVSNLKNINFGDIYYEEIYKEVKYQITPYLDLLKDLLKDLPKDALDKTSFRLMGCSGVVKQVFSILNFKNENINKNEFKINKASYKDLKQIKDKITQTLKIDDPNTNKLSFVNIPGLREDRVEVFPAGLGILCALFEILGFDEVNDSKEDVCIELSCGGLREGLVFDFLKLKT
jgi:exopolyphosphatase / guanosine-5'-triphosphate,3'-diphosphate pyrophosphatase